MDPSHNILADAFESSYNNKQSDDQPKPEKRNKKEREIVDLDKKRDQPKRPAWKVHRNIKEGDLLRTTPPEKILELANSKLGNIRDRALFLTLYICAARVEELVTYKRVTWGNKEVLEVSIRNKPKIRKVQDYSKKIMGPEMLGIKKENIAEENYNGQEVVVFSIRNLKNKTENRKRIPFILNTPTYKEMWKTIKTYLYTLEEEEPLFRFGRRRAWKIIKPTGWNPHSLRALRLTHLVRFHNFADQRLRLFSGWSDSRPAKHYIKLGWEDLVEGMKDK
jgi:hypothetical protein